MHTALAYEVQKVVLAERLDRASRPPLPELSKPHCRRRPSRLARRAIAAVILVLSAWMVLGATSALAAGKTLYVSSSASSDPVCGLASQSNPFATVAGALACAANGSTISIGAGSFAGGFTITHNVVLQGAGSGTVIMSDASVPIESVTEVTVADGHSVTLKSLTVDGGVRQHDVVVGSGSLMVVNSTITGGVASYGGAINVSPAAGATAQLTVLRSTLANNLAFTYGGAIYVADGPPAARNSVSVIDSTITANQSDSAAGAIKIGLLDSLSVRDSTIARNQASHDSGGLLAQGASGSTGNPSVVLTNTILAANTAAFGPPDCEALQGVTDGGHNVIGAVDGSCPGISNGVNGDQAGTLASPLDPVLGQLAGNGGPTQTLALRVGSPAIGAGDPADCQATPVSGTDQRNQKRNAATRLACDTGAYDTSGTPLQTLYVSRSASSDPVCGLASQSNPFATVAGALACAANGSTISIGAGSFAGGFTITHNVVLQGAGSGTVIMSDASVPIESVTEVTVADGHNVTLKSLTVDGGVRQHDVVVGSGSLMVVNSTITGGVASYGGAINVSPAAGATAQLTVLRSTLANNLAFTYGGAIYVADGPPAARNSVSVIDSTITANQSDSAAGAIKIGLLDSLSVRDSTIARNQASHDSGGLLAQGASGSTGNPSVVLTNTILAANTAAFGPPDCEALEGVTDGGHNVIGAVDGSCPGISNGVNGDQAGTLASPLDPVLGQLAGNGGPTQTLALRVGSPAIGAGDPADCQATPVSGTDQRNQKRNAATRLACDTGAYDTSGH